MTTKLEEEINKLVDKYSEIIADDLTRLIESWVDGNLVVDKKEQSNQQEAE